MNVQTNTERDVSKIDYYNKWLEKAKEIVLKNIDRSKYAAFLYGSMVYDPLNAYDMDIGIMGNEKVPFETMETIREEIESSIVPFRFDLVDFKDTPEKFRKFAFGDMQIWNKPSYIELK